MSAQKIFGCRDGARLVALAVIAGAMVVQLPTAAAASADEQQIVESWRATRVQELTSPTGWLALEGLFWLKPGVNTFGRGRTEQMRLDHPELPLHAGAFILDGQAVRFSSADQHAITLNNVPVASVLMTPDSAAAPTVLARGTLEFFVIERGGRFGVRVRDRESPRRRNFHGLKYFPVDDGWVYAARFEAYSPEHIIPIINILGMEVEMTSPGAVVFEREGHQWRLDTVLERPDAEELFIMFADATSGGTSYGGGRFLKTPLPLGGVVRLDFNLAYNPPCAFNTFATCPLPPPQNRIALSVTAGELKYAVGGH